MPGWIHATQIVKAVCCSHQSVDLTLASLELSQVMEASHDGRDGLLDQRDQLLGVHVLWLPGWGQGNGRVLLGLFVPRDDLITKDGLQDSIHL